MWIRHFKRQKIDDIELANAICKKIFTKNYDDEKNDVIAFWKSIKNILLNNLGMIKS